MNFFNQFLDFWNSRFDNVVAPPQLDCLKADQFSSLQDQKQALEFQHAKICSVIEELKEQIARENLTAEFLQKCIQKLSAVSHVFNEIDQCDSKSSSSSGTSNRHPGSSVSPILQNNGVGISQNQKGLYSAPCSTLPLFPQCIASSFINSASPLLAAAVATSSPFMLPSNLSQFSCSDALKLDPDSEHLNGKASSNFFLQNRSLSCSSGSVAPNPGAFNPFSAGFSPRSLRVAFEPPASSSTCGADEPQEDEDRDETKQSTAAAAAAVAAALGLDLASVRSNQLMNLAPNNGIESAPNHNAERPFQCARCPRNFAVKAGLVQHMRTHTDERPYPCSHCGRAFKQKIQLTTHMRVHSGERPYGCRLCGKLFRQQSHVVQHLRTHTGEKPHKCYLCGKAFRQKYSLISHQRRLCRNRAASNPIAAGMTMWISPGAGGDTCNLVKEFSPSKQQQQNNGSADTPTGGGAAVATTTSPSEEARRS